MRWRYDWLDLNGAAGHIRGVDVYTVEDGLIAGSCHTAKDEPPAPYPKFAPRPY